MTQADDRCINPSEIRAVDLIAFAEDEAGPATKSHIERCGFCRRQAVVYAGMERVMNGVLYRRSCIPSLTLGEYAIGVLEPLEMRAVAEHLLDCPHCLAESRSFSAFLAHPDEPLPDQGILAGLRRLIATRRDAPAPALSGLRGTATEESVTYVAEDCLVHVSVQSAAPGRSDKVIAGLVEWRTGIQTNAVARLYDDDRLLQTESVDDLGIFQFSRVSLGAHRIEVTIPDAVVVIEAIHVE
jgi:hypothetical protein